MCTCKKYQDSEVLPDEDNNCSLCGSKLNEQGECTKDLFDDISTLPDNVQAILLKYQMAETGEELDRMNLELNEVGYTFDYGLDLIPVNLKKL